MHLQVQEGGCGNPPGEKITKHQILPKLTSPAVDLLEWRWTSKLSGSGFGTDSTKRGERRRGENVKNISCVLASFLNFGFFLSLMVVVSHAALFYDQELNG